MHRPSGVIGYLQEIRSDQIRGVCARRTIESHGVPDDTDARQYHRDRSEGRSQQPERRDGDADNIIAERPREILANDDERPSCERNQPRNLTEIVTQDRDVGRFAREVGRPVAQ